MSFESQVITSASPFCALEEVLKLLNISKSEVLKLGAEGQINLFIKVPDGINVMEVDINSLGLMYFNENNMDVSTWDKFLANSRVNYHNLNLNYLTLGVKVSRELFRSPEVVRHTFMFNSGYILKKKLVKPISVADKSDRLMSENNNTLKYFDGNNLNIYLTCLVTYVNLVRTSVICKGVEVTDDSVYIMRSDLSKIESYIRVKYQLEVDGTSFKNQIYTSKKLMRLTIAAQKFWRGTNLDEALNDYKKPPSDIEVQKFLCENKMFDKTLARIACGLIRPKYATRNVSSKEKLDKSDYITKELKGLWDASNKFWSQFDPENPLVNNGVLSSDVENWLKDHCNFSEKRSIAGATIIRPNAGKGRPRKNV